ncbi:MAG: hypothetical protein ACUVS7_02530 [Bryobacteraceae bacterium]
MIAADVAVDADPGSGEVAKKIAQESFRAVDDLAEIGAAAVLVNADADNPAAAVNATQQRGREIAPAFVGGEKFGSVGDRLENIVEVVHKPREREISALVSILITHDDLSRAASRS